METEISFAPGVPYITVTVTTEKPNVPPAEIKKAALSKVRNDSFFRDFHLYDSKAESETVTAFYAKAD